MQVSASRLGCAPRTLALSSDVQVLTSCSDVRTAQVPHMALLCLEYMLMFSSGSLKQLRCLNVSPYP